MWATLCREQGAGHLQKWWGLIYRTFTTYQLNVYCGENPLILLQSERLDYFTGILCENYVIFSALNYLLFLFWHQYTQSFVHTCRSIKAYGNIDRNLQTCLRQTKKYTNLPALTLSDKHSYAGHERLTAQETKTITHKQIT